MPNLDTSDRYEYLRIFCLMVSKLKQVTNLVHGLRKFSAPVKKMSKNFELVYLQLIPV